MDALSPSDPCEEVILKWAAQTAKTEVILNFIGFIVDQDPGPILCIQPNVSPMGESFSKDRVAPMIRDTPTLRGRVADARERDSGNTLTHKKFAGGHLTIAGANSPAGLAARPIRYLIGDERNRWENTKEGSPLALGKKRQQTFHNRKRLLASSPTIAGVGIDDDYEKAERQYERQLRCLGCGEWQFPELKHFVWEDGKLEEAMYACGHCGFAHALSDEDRLKATAEWICVKDEGDQRKAFWMNQFASPFASWLKTLREYIEAKDSPEALRVFENTALAKNQQGAGDGADQHELARRREIYRAEVPAGVAVLSAGADVHPDRIEIEVVGWAPNLESWTVDWRVVHGSPDQPTTWAAFDEVLLGAWRHEGGHEMRIAAVCIDSGYSAQNVYKFVAPRSTRGVYAIKGFDGAGRPVAKIGKPGKIKGPTPERIYILGVDSIKDTLYSFFRSEPGEAGFCHWPTRLPGERDMPASYFDQLTAEERVTRWRRGARKVEWIKKRPRNEALDCRVYAYAALTILNPVWSRLRDRMIAGPAVPAPRHVPQRGMRSSGVNV